MIKKFGPWAMCLVIFIYIFRDTSPLEVWESLRHANLGLFTLYAVAYFFFIHALDTYTLTHFISRFVTPISYKEGWLVRGVSYIIMVINYHAASGAFAIYLKKTHKASISKTLGTMAFVSIMDLIMIFTSAFIALFYGNIEYRGFEIKPFLVSVAPFLYGGYLLWILYWKFSEHPRLKFVKAFGFTKWILDHNIFHIFREANLKDYLILLLHRAPLVFVVVGVYNLAIYSFQGTIGWFDMYLYNPIIMFVSTIPITPSGLGTSQLLTLEFFSDKISSPLFTNGSMTPESLLLASSLVWPLANLILKAIFGAICLSRTSKNLFIDETNDSNS